MRTSSSLITVLFGGLVLLCLSQSSSPSSSSWLRRQQLPPAHNSVVLITGCDTGFGSLATTVLSRAGYKVVASCLTVEGCQRLHDVAALTVQCDVSRDGDVANLAQATEAYLASDRLLRLWCVVNNAGIAPLGYVDWLRMDTFRRVMDVNYFGLVAVTKQCLPLLKRTRGSRVINISSVAGLSGLPMFGAYAASKHAVEGFSKCLRQELRPWGIKVANVNPAFMKTPMVLDSPPKTLEEFLAADQAVARQYEEVEAKLRAVATPLEVGEGPEVVVDMILRLVQAPDPALVNFTGLQAAALRFFLLLPAAVQEFFLGKIALYAPSAATLASIQGPPEGAEQE